jgi:uncharacterized membrane protein YfcA
MPILEPTFIVVCAVVLISGLIYGMFGFGYTVVSVALLPYFIGVKIAVPMVAIQVPIYTGLMLYGLRQHLVIRFAIPLILGMIPGLPIGVHLLRILSEATIQRLLGVMILLYSIWSLWNISPATPLLRHRAWGLLTGFLSGIIGGAILASGPIIVAYLMLRGYTKETFKATFLLWAMSTFCLLIPSYAISGVFTHRILLWGITTLPFSFLGMFLGIKLFNKMEEQLFYRLIIVFLAFTGIRLLVS